MRKMFWSRLRLSSGKKDRHSEEGTDSMKGTSNVNEEYNEAFRTKSYTELCNKVQDQLQTRMCPDKGQSFSSSHKEHHAHLSEYILDPPQETLTTILENSELHHFLINYFDYSYEAGKICESILRNIHEVGRNHRAIRNITKLIDQFPDSTRWTHTHYDMLYKNLASLATKDNPFSSTPDKFLELHDSQVQLLHQLTSQYRKTKRRTKIIKYIKRVFATSAALGSGALAITLLILAANCTVGMVAAPGLLVCCLGVLMMKRLKGHKRKSKKTGLEEQLDVAARGVYTLINDFDTMGQLVKGLYNEMERRRYVAETCVEKGKNEMVKEVVKDFQMHESCFLEEVEELKNHIYLCFLNINRARRLLVQEIV